MKRFSNEFRPALREIRQLNAIVSYSDPKGFYILTTENDDNLLTENEFEIATESGVIDYDKETINSVNPLFNTSLFKTTCKSVQIECKNPISKGTSIEVRIGVYKNNEDKYEYLNYGRFYVNEEPVYQADSNDYLVIGYDKMIESMVSYDDSPLSITFPIKHKDFVIAICNKFGWNYDLIDYPNANKNIVQDFYKGQNLTYRDILDDLNGVCGGSFMFNLYNKLTWKRPTETNQIVEDDDLKDVNVDFAEKYGKVNVLTITTNGNVVLDSKEDTQSIQENGRSEFNIDDNYILNYSTDDFIDEIFNEVNGLEYYLYDVDSTGLLIFEPLDMFTFRHNNIDYKTIMFNDDIKLTQGLVETTFAEKPEEEKKDYKTTDKDKNKLNNALISIDKANAEIQLKANKADVEASLELKVSKDDNDQVVSMINASANEINLKSNRLIVESNNFNLTKEGDMTCSNANITGGNIKLYGTDKFPSFKVYNPNNNQEYTEISSNAIKMWENGIAKTILFGQAGFFGLTGDENSIVFTPNLIYAQSIIGGESKFSLNSSDGNITCVSLTQTSLKENKKNFEKYSGALEEIKNIDIYKYNLKNEENDSKKHLGFVIGDDFNYSKVVTSDDNKGVDNYSFTSLCLQAIKEQQEQIENLQKQVNELKEMIKNG